MRKQNGITLVSLVVTIIVLIILAGISINILLGENGIITRAQQAQENTILAQEEEAKQLNTLYSQLNYIGSSSGNVGDVDNEVVAKLTEFKSAIATVITNEGVNTLETDSVETMVGNIGKILQERTKDATATADNISEVKTAWVNGQLITGNGNDVNNAYNSGKQEQNLKQYSLNFSIGINTTSSYNLDNYILNGSLVTASITSWSEPYTAKATSFEMSISGNVVSIKYSSQDVGFTGNGTMVLYYYEII